jgi:hypothetical protein
MASEPVKFRGKPRKSPRPLHFGAVYQDEEHRGVPRPERLSILRGVIKSGNFSFLGDSCGNKCPAPALDTAGIFIGANLARFYAGTSSQSKVICLHAHIAQYQRLLTRARLVRQTGLADIPDKFDFPGRKRIETRNASSSCVGCGPLWGRTHCGRSALRGFRRPPAAKSLVFLLRGRKVAPAPSGPRCHRPPVDLD